MSQAQHIPVLINEVIAAFSEQPRPLKIFLEGTFGRGGHTRALLAHFPGLKVHTFDKDLDALEAGRVGFATEIATGQLVLIHDDFKNFQAHEVPPLDGAFVDLGVSSPQFDTAERGFSFQNDGPLDMRMDQTQKLTASRILDEYSENELTRIFKEYGEVHAPYRVVRAIVHDRKTTPFTRTHQLAGLIERVEGWRKKGIHPATNYFMALRIAVNEELAGLDEFLNGVVGHLGEGGRCVVISFHSLEDRIVKNIFRSLQNPCVCPPDFPVCKCGRTSQGQVITRKVIVPNEEEIKTNPRARSAKMRVFEKHT